MSSDGKTELFIIRAGWKASQENEADSLTRIIVVIESTSALSTSADELKASAILVTPLEQFPKCGTAVAVLRFLFRS